MILFDQLARLPDQNRFTQQRDERARIAARSLIGEYRFDPRKLVTDKGEINRAYLVHEARRRASGEWGNTNPPAVYVRPHVQNLEVQAFFVRAEWRRDHHLPDDTCYVDGFTMPAVRCTRVIP